MKKICKNCKWRDGYAAEAEFITRKNKREAKAKAVLSSPLNRYSICMTDSFGVIDIEAHEFYEMDGFYTFVVYEKKMIEFSVTAFGFVISDDCLSTSAECVFKAKVEDVKYVALTGRLGKNENAKD